MQKGSDLKKVEELVRDKKKREAINVVYELMLTGKNKDFYRGKIKEIK